MDKSKPTDPVVIGRGLLVHPDLMDWRFVKASGPGGQHVNKVATAVQLRFDLAGAPNLPAPMKARAARLAGRRMTQHGEIVIMADRFRTQEANRRDALARLVALLAEAAVPPKARRATRPTPGSRERRLEAKARRSGIKQGRARPAPE